MTARGLDTYGAVSPAHLAGYDFICRYVAQQPVKCITPSEARGYLAAKKSLVLVYEDEANDGLGGAAMGSAKARIALPILKSIGWPAWRPVYFAFDMPGYAADLPTFIACAKAFASGIGAPPAVYGDVDTCTAAHAAGIKYLWQFGEGRAPGITIWQGPSTTAPWGQSIDPDTAFVTDYGQWSPHSTPPVPTPAPTEDEMQFIAQSPDGPASFLYDVSTKTRRGLTQPASVALLEAVGVKNYGSTLNKTVLAGFTLGANWD